MWTLYMNILRINYLNNASLEGVKYTVNANV